MNRTMKDGSYIFSVLRFIFLTQNDHLALHNPKKNVSKISKCVTIREYFDSACSFFDCCGFLLWEC